jgi:uncharacterized protein YukE
MTVNPLVVPRIDQPADMWAGIWIAEDIELIAEGVRTRSWVDTSIGSVSATLDGLAFVADPFSGLLQYFAAALMEHFGPLREALDWLAGDPGQIAGHAQTWRNVSASLASEHADLTAALNADTAAWVGATAAAYRGWAGLQHSAVGGLTHAAEAMAVITECAGLVVATVRVMVRDLIAIAFSRAVTYVTEEVFSLGFATPVVAAQVGTLVLQCAARITRLLHGVVTSLARLFETAARLARHIDGLTRILTRLGNAAPNATILHPPAGAGGRIPGSLEGQREVSVADPADPGRTITDIDDVRDGVLWEEKSATWAGDEKKWVTKQVISKLESYLEARQHLPGYENAPIGLRMTEPGVQPSLRAAIESAIDDFRKAHPGVEIRLEFAP